MESRENMMPVVETTKSEATSSYQLAVTTNNPTATKTESPSPMMGPGPGPLGFSPASGGVSSSFEKKKRGRPRKYGPDGVAVNGGVSGRTLSPLPLSSINSPASGGYSDIKFGELAGSGSEFQAEKKRRRRMGSSEKSSMSLGGQITSGGSFTPHMVTVNPGEDVTSKIISFSRNGPRAICVLSAHGIISQVTLHQTSSSGATVTYEGRFEILSLSGSFAPGEVEGMSSREGGMSIALSSSDGRVVGGLVGGLLTAAGPVQVVVGSFLPEGGNPVVPKPRKQKYGINLCTPVADLTVARITNVEQHEFYEQSQESPTTEDTNYTSASNYQHENHIPTQSVHDWRRASTDMNVSLRED